MRDTGRPLLDRRRGACIRREQARVSATANPNRTTHLPLPKRPAAATIHAKAPLPTCVLLAVPPDLLLLLVPPLAALMRAMPSPAGAHVGVDRAEYLPDGTKAPGWRYGSFMQGPFVGCRAHGMNSTRHTFRVSAR